MAHAYQLEQSVDRYLLEDGTGVYLIENEPHLGPPESTYMSLLGVGR